MEEMLEITRFWGPDALKIPYLEIRLTAKRLTGEQKRQLVEALDSFSKLAQGIICPEPADGDGTGLLERLLSAECE